MEAILLFNYKSSPDIHTSGIIVSSQGIWIKVINVDQTWTPRGIKYRSPECT